MTAMEKKTMDDPAAHQGAIESDRPSQETNVDDRPTGVDRDGMPNDPNATAQDRIGALEGESERGWADRRLEPTALPCIALAMVCCGKAVRFTAILSKSHKDSRENRQRRLRE